MQANSGHVWNMSWLINQLEVVQISFGKNGFAGDHSHLGDDIFSIPAIFRACIRNA